MHCLGAVVYERVILVNYHETGLRGRNRGRFERVLPGNLTAALGDLAPGRALEARP